MKNRLLIIGCDQSLKQNQKKKCLNDGLCSYFFGSLGNVAKELYGGNDYSLVLICGGVDVMEAVKTVRRLSRVPILVMRKKYDGAEKIEALENGADEYMQYPVSREEGMASARALIRRYTEWNPCQDYIGCQPAKEGLCILPENRQVFINSREIFFARKEFDMLYTLASSPDRVFTYEQLFYRVWKEEGSCEESHMHSCVNRVRRKLESVPGFQAEIENVRGVGYRYKNRHV